MLASSISIASFVSLIGAPAEIMGASCGLTFSITSGFIKKFLKTIRNKKKKHNRIVMLARSKLNGIESKISEALINKKKYIESWKKALEWWIDKDVMLKKLVWLKRVKK